MCSGKSRGSRNEINRTRDETGETWRGRERAKPKAEAIRRSFRFFSPPPPSSSFFLFFIFSPFSPGVPPCARFGIPCAGLARKRRGIELMEFVSG